jgi:hypothetical protein
MCGGRVTEAEQLIVRQYDEKGVKKENITTGVIKQ